MGERLKIAVYKHDDNSMKFVLIHDGTNVCDVSFLENLEMADVLTSKVKSLIKEGGASDRNSEHTVKLMGRDFALTFTDIINAAVNFISVSRWIGVK